MRTLMLRSLAYFFGVVAGFSVVSGVILRIARGPGGSLFFGIRPAAHLRFTQASLLFAIALGIAAILEQMREQKQKEEE